MLEVVEHQQLFTVPQVLLEPVDQRTAARLSNAERITDGVQDEIGVQDRRQRHEARAVRELLVQRGGDSQGQVRLAAATGTSQRDEAHVVAAQQPLRLSTLAQPPNQRASLNGEAPGAGRLRACSHKLHERASRCGGSPGCSCGHRATRRVSHGS